MIVSSSHEKTKIKTSPLVRTSQLSHDQFPACYNGERLEDLGLIRELILVFSWDLSLTPRSSSHQRDC